MVCARMRRTGFQGAAPTGGQDAPGMRSRNSSDDALASVASHPATGGVPQPFRDTL